MRLLSFRDDRGASWGVREDTVVRDLGRLPEVQGRTLGEVLRDGTLEKVLTNASAAEAVSLEAVTLLPPVTDSQKVICVGLNYADHVAEMNRETPTHPVIFTRFPDSLVGADVPLESSPLTDAFDYEGELAIIIGKEATAVSVEAAAGHILGYSVLNDGSMRDYQRHTHQFTPGKNFTRSGSFGPEIVTVDEVGELGQRRITTELSGEVLQDSTLDQLIFSPADLIAYISSWTTLRPGDVIATGTPGGVGDSFTPKKYMRPGDTVTVTIEGIGELRNTIA